MRRDALERQDQVALFFQRNPSASAREAARELGFSTPTVLKHMRILGLPVRPKPRRTSDEMETDAREAAALFAAGKPLAEIGKKQGHSRVTVGRDLGRLGIEHDRHSAPSMHRARERTRAQRSAESETLQAYCSRNNLWTVAQAAEWLGRDYRTVGFHADRGRLAVAETLGPRGPGRVRLLRSRDVKILGKELADTCVAFYDLNDPVEFSHSLEDRGIERARVRELIRRRQEAAMRAALSRPGTGRPPSPGPPAYHFEWARSFNELMAELVAQHEAYHVRGDRAPTNFDVAQLVAEDDFDEYPERWDYDPHDRPDKAKRRVWMAVKPLIQAVNETRAA